MKQIPSLNSTVTTILLFFSSVDPQSAVLLSPTAAESKAEAGNDGGVEDILPLAYQANREISSPSHSSKLLLLDLLPRNLLRVTHSWKQPNSLLSK
jgi:hypothetical protein